MICPKCQNQMRTVDRLGVHVEQCEGCRGIFLDRGELEQIAAAEQQHYSAAPPAYQPEPYAVHGSRPDSPPPFRAEHHRRYPDSPKPYGGHYQDSPRPYGHKRKRRGFLEDLFD
ncbi:zf-TFIIB domain-containing protein [Labedaea rhizosphaerae]|nr:zf-TFIIB domain-containing protein [Labedaea rhizosphaerae]